MRVNARVGSLSIFVNFRKSGTQKGSTGVFKESQVVPARSAEVGWAAAVTSPSNCLIIQHKLDPKNSPLTIRIKISSVSLGLPILDLKTHTLGGYSLGGYKISGYRFWI